MLKAHEELWEIKLNPKVDKLITEINGKRREDLTKAVTCKIPFNSCV